MSVLGDLIAQGQQLLSEAARGSEATTSAIEHWPQRVGNTFRGSRFASMDRRHFGAVGERLAVQIDIVASISNQITHSNALLGAEMN
jgi:hypothetical protein